MPKMSVIVPVYNVERYIDKCLDTLVNQTSKLLLLMMVHQITAARSTTDMRQWMNV